MERCLLIFTKHIAKHIHHKILEFFKVDDYGVCLKNDSFGYYYELERNSDFKIERNIYRYKSLLKGT